MYIRLGKSTLINDPGKYNDEFFIVSQIVDSQLGYEKPIIVKNKKQLDTWFGNNYSDYTYMSSLIEKGLCLYISKPLSITNSNYTEESNTFYCEDIQESVNSYQGGVIIKTLPKKGEEKFIYKVIDPQGTQSYLTKDGEIISYTKKTYSKEFDTYTPAKDSEVSGDNRDSLIIFNKECPVRSCTPSFKPNTINPNGYYIRREDRWVYSASSNNVKFKGDTLKDLSGILNLNTEGNKIKLEKELYLNVTQKDVESINDEYKTLVFDINFSEYKDGSYITIKNLYSNKSYLIYNSESTKKPSDIFKSTKVNKYFADGEGFRTMKVTTVEELKNVLGLYGYYIENDSIYAFQPVPVTYFTNLNSFVPNFQKSQDLIYQSFKDYESIKLYSRTLGTGGVEGNIEVEVEEINNDSIIVSTSRFGYTEIIETTRDTIDQSINNESSLIYCDLKDTNFHTIENTEMKGAAEEIHTKSMYNNTTDYLFQYSNVYPDYFLIPDTTRYIADKDLGDTFYKTILSYATSINCQVLIHNTWDNYKKNYLWDLDNRLIYFLGDIKLGKTIYPGYYLYLEGLVGNIFSVDSDKILYKSPTDIFGQDIYSKDYKVEFDKYKSNYLTYNDKKYYYKNYLNGEKYNTTGWMRFAISKITREIEKNKWQLIGVKDTESVILERMSIVLNKIVKSFRIIDSIKIKQFNLDLAKNKLDIKLQTSVNDLVKNDITLELTVNYSNKT